MQAIRYYPDSAKLEHESAIWEFGCVLRRLNKHNKVF